MFKYILISLPLFFIGAFFLLKEEFIKNTPDTFTRDNTPEKSANVATPTPQSLPSKKILENNYHVFQTFNNCGPATLSMALSYFGVNKSQEELGKELRPYQNPQGDNDDKSVTLEEFAEKAKEYGLLSYYRPNGNIKLIKAFIANDIPVVTKTWLKENEDIGHFRIIKGYDEPAKQIVQDDSYQGKNLRYSYDEFNVIWKKFNHEYIVIVPKEKQSIAESILGEDIDPEISWQKAVQNSKKELETDPDDIYSRFNLSVALYHTGDYKNSTLEFEKVEKKLAFRTLWYQIEPIKAYYELGDYQRVFSITENILNNHNRAFSQLYLIRGYIYQKQGELDSAKEEFKKAVFYNINLKEAQEALNSVN